MTVQRVSLVRRARNLRDIWRLLSSTGGRGGGGGGRARGRGKGRGGFAAGGAGQRDLRIGDLSYDKHTVSFGTLQGQKVVLTFR